MRESEEKDEEGNQERRCAPASQGWESDQRRLELSGGSDEGR